MELTLIRNSSTVQGIAIDGNDLIIQFKTGLYRYLNGAAHYAKILAVSNLGASVGEYVAKNVKKQLPYVKMNG